MLIVIRSILLKLIGICKANNQSKAADIHQLSPSVLSMQMSICDHMLNSSKRILIKKMQ